MSLQTLILANLHKIDAIMLDCDDEQIAQFYFVDKDGNNIFENTDLPIKKFGFHFYRTKDLKYNGIRFYIPTVDEHFISIVLPIDKPLKVVKENQPKHITALNKKFLKVLTTFAIEHSLNLNRKTSHNLEQKTASVQNTTSSSNTINSK